MDRINSFLEFVGCLLYTYWPTNLSHTVYVTKTAHIQCEAFKITQCVVIPNVQNKLLAVISNIEELYFLPIQNFQDILRRA